ncbi:ABC transporter substrate-binding protein [Achromobacter denitrificans]|jgi:tripartite-type tricarboxylate transporter receptor subunit TctC|uniref:ABC transporter substrate-binding protein n=1 Tax=Achromobacter denitrificans TaxID=32002 RepID=A0A6N0JGM5_ACHDE|nr:MULTISPECIES: tripartite tricarboxylate transporter substrate-binding protein [Achromobacter]MBV2157063.1 ABC transporter substrate-binding protein [Achromobacter denitrificans]MDF3849161.1 tripartite tricarboxylate transporter substrate-binding protein [Achromobacter denitrificans]MDX3877686.1 tripartite tricarboxylate transporter substrate-binding protein [Achromobacter sp.]QKQ46222.1 ABC transporter substrate-binding protein [Achromobacter denitrificans]WFC69804.1 ABC transporter substra
MASTMASRLRRALAASLAFGIMSGAALAADTYPSKPINFLIGYKGVSEVFSRVIAEKLQQELGQPVIVMPHPGASGGIAAGMLARAAPDGYTVGMVISNLATNSILQKDLEYDPIKSFEPISMMGTVPIVMAINPKAAGGIADFKTFVADAKAHPDKYAFGQAGALGMTHLTGELLKRDAHIKMISVSYRGGGAALVDLMGGQIAAQFPTVTLIGPHYQSKDPRVKVVAISARERSPVMPDVPTFTELGYPGIVVSEWYALMAPAGTPKPIVDRLNAALRKVLDQPDVKDKILGMDVAGSDPQAVTQLIRSEIERWSALIHEVGLKLE